MRRDINSDLLVGIMPELLHQDRMRLHQSKLLLPNQPYHDEFIETMTRIFNWSRWIGVMGPGSRVWKACSLLLFVLLIIIEGGAIWKVIKALAGWAVDIEGSRSVTARLSGTMFYSSAIASLVLSSKFFLGWDSLVELWVSIERATAFNIPQDSTLKKRMLIVVVTMAICSILEHLVSVIALIEIDCPPDLILKRYILRSHGFLLLRNEYSVWFAFPLLFIYNVATALWNFQDTLVILVSMGLTSRYIRLNKYVAKVCAEDNKGCENEKTETVRVYKWRRIREAYVKQAALVRKVDGRIGGVILLSSFGNFYFICLQLFLGITTANRILYFLGKNFCDYIMEITFLCFYATIMFGQRPPQFEYRQGLYGAAVLKLTYYMLSLIWIMVRFTWMVMAAADVNAHSKDALRHLYECNSHCYNSEIDRLQNQLRKDYVALSGLGFYTMNRTILLKMAASVVTYELVLIQYEDKGSTDQ